MTETKKAAHAHEELVELVQMISRDMRRIIDGEVNSDRAMAEAVLINCQDVLEKIES